jgi:hypothetical protein
MNDIKELEDAIIPEVEFLIQEISKRGTGKTRVLLNGPDEKTNVIVQNQSIGAEYNRQKRANYIAVHNMNHKLRGSKNPILIDQEVVCDYFHYLLRIISEKDLEIEQIKTWKDVSERKSVFAWIKSLFY